MVASSRKVAGLIVVLALALFLGAAAVLQTVSDAAEAANAAQSTADEASSQADDLSNRVDDVEARIGL